MKISYDYERLLPLLSSLHTLTGIRADLFDQELRSVCVNQEQGRSFCARINAIPQGHERCLRCDREAMGKVKSGKPFFYRCHAELCESILPISEGENPLAFLFSGQYLDDAPMEQQWEKTKKALAWYPGDPEELREDFEKIPRYTQVEIDAYSRILAALGAYIRLECIVQSAEQTDAQRLERYLDIHYREKLSLERISSDLGIGRTRLCALAKTISGGSTLSRMITNRRMEEAKYLLRKSDIPVSAVAEAVGVSDYNYFTKVFRASTGMTPSEFRRSSRPGRQGKNS